MFKVNKVNPDFNNLKIKNVPKTDAELKLHIDKLKDKSLVKKLFTSKLLLGGGVVSTLSAVYVDHYIKGNTGCFLESKENICKIKELSCCNPYESKYIETCSDEIIKRLNIDKNTCLNYDLNDPNCCKKCDCQHYSCEVDEKMFCRKATIAESLTYFKDNMISSVNDTFYNLLTSSGVIKILFISFLGIIMVIFVYKIV